jgi:hypothetical protein
VEVGYVEANVLDLGSLETYDGYLEGRVQEGGLIDDVGMLEVEFHGRC